MLEGVDISYAQANYTPGDEHFIIINASRANNGGLNVGSYYHRQVDTARAHGKEVGHYFFNGNISVASCADFFINNLYDFRPGDVLVLDVEAEPTSGTAAWTPDQVLQFAQIVKARTGQSIGIYLNKSLMNGYNWSAVVNFGCWLWIAYYSDSTPTISWWPNWTMWQYTSAGGLDKNKSQTTLAAISGSVAPIKEDIDMSYSLVPYGTGIGVVSLITGNYTGLSQYHLTLMQRLKKNDANDLMLQAELDICRAYLQAINPTVASGDSTPITDAQVTAIADQVAAKTPIPPHEFTLTGKATA